MSIVTLHSLNSGHSGVGIGCLDSHGRIFVHGETYNLAGQHDSGNTHAELYDPASDTWSVLAASNQYQSLAAWTIDPSDRVIVFGGLVFPAPPGTASFTGTDRGEIYNPATDTWTSIARIPTGGSFQGRYLQMAFWGDAAGQLWVMGGTMDSGAQDNVSTGPQVFRNAVKYSGGPSGTWSLLSSPANYSGATSTAGSTVGRGLLFPNRQSVNPTVLFDASGRVIASTTTTDTSGLYHPELYDPAADTWAALTASTQYAGRNGASYALAQVGQVGYAFLKPALKQYDIATDTWTALYSSPGPPFEGIFFALGSQLYLVGTTTTSSSNIPTTAIWTFDPAGTTWSTLTDVLSVARIPIVVTVPSAPGAYFIGGGLTSTTVSTVVEWWSPTGAPPPVPAARSRSFGTIVGD